MVAKWKYMSNCGVGLFFFYDSTIFVLQLSHAEFVLILNHPIADCFMFEKNTYIHIS